MVDFAGWEMPVSYSGILAEHLAVRRAAGLFDVSHMGEIEVRGAGAEAFVDWLTPNRVRGLATGRAQYSALLTERGTYVDDLLVYRLDRETILLVVNASNTAKDLAWIRERAGEWASDADRRTTPVSIDDTSDATALLALQGPLAVEILAPLADGDVGALRSFGLVTTRLGSDRAVVSRTGYTGEDGFEIFIAPDAAERVWKGLLDAGRERGLVPVGLGARDSLRLEAGLCLYGHEIDDTVTPFEAGLDWVVKLDDGDFVGRDALIRQRAAGVPRRLVGLELEGRRIGRADAAVWSDDAAIGRVTSGTWSPFLERSIAMALVGAGHAAAGSRVEVEVRETREPAQVRGLPFYRRQRGPGKSGKEE